MKKIILIIVFAFSLSLAYSQVLTPINGYGQKHLRIKVDSFLLPPTDTIYSAPLNCIAVKNGIFYIRKATKWDLLSGASASISKVYSGYGLANVNDSTLKADSATLANYFLRRKDSTTYYPYKSNPLGYLTAATATIPTLQQVLVAGSTLTQSNVIDGGGFDLVNYNFNTIEDNATTSIGFNINGTSALSLTNTAAQFDRKLNLGVANSYTSGNYSVLVRNTTTGTVEKLAVSALNFDTTTRFTGLATLGKAYNDSIVLASYINLKVNISDTASMLSPYLRFYDTTAMLLPYLRKIDTASLSSRIDATTWQKSLINGSTLTQNNTIVGGGFGLTLNNSNFFLQNVTNENLISTDIATDKVIIGKTGDNSRIENTPSSITTYVKSNNEYKILRAVDSKDMFAIDANSGFVSVFSPSTHIFSTQLRNNSLTGNRANLFPDVSGTFIVDNSLFTTLTKLQADVAIIN